MKFALESKQVTLPSEPEVTPTVESVSEAYEGLLTSYMELSDAQRNLDEVCQVMENIELSMKMLQSGSADAVKLLNIDRSLENLLGVAEEKLTVQSATEGFTDALKAAWEKFKGWCQKIWSWIVEFFTNSSKKHKALEEQIKALEQKLKASDQTHDLDRILDSGVNVKFNISPNSINKLETDLTSLLNAVWKEFESNGKYLQKLEEIYKRRDNYNELKTFRDESKDNFLDLEFKFEDLIRSHFNGSFEMKSWKEHGYTSGAQVLSTLNRISNLLDLIDDHYGSSSFIHSHNDWLKSFEDVYQTPSKDDNPDYTEKLWASSVIYDVRTAISHCAKLEKCIVTVSHTLSHALSIMNANLIRQLASPVGTIGQK